jgi:RNA polymerase sigma factor (TIGR02999 family)
VKNRTGPNSNVGLIILGIAPKENLTGYDLTRLFVELARGDRQALSRIVAELYADLRRLAHARLRRRGDSPTLLDTTALVHESYLRFLHASQIQITDRAHFLAYASRVMRSVVVDCVRERSSQRRGGGDVRITLDDGIAERLSGGEREILKVHEALEELAEVSPRLVTVVEMRYFGGVSEPEIAEALGITERTVRRDWEKARILLAAALK